MKPKYALGLCCLCALAGCATPMPVLTDFSEIKAEVRVHFDALAGPSFDEARQASESVGEEHCRSMGKKSIYVSGRKESKYIGSVPVGGTSVNMHATEYVFLYRCEPIWPHEGISTGES